VSNTSREVLLSAWAAEWTEAALGQVRWQDDDRESVAKAVRSAVRLTERRPPVFSQWF